MGYLDNAGLARVWDKIPSAVIYDISAEFHSETSDHYFTFLNGVDASSILSALNEGKLPVVQNSYGSLKRKWYFADYNNDGNDIYIQFFR